MSNFNILIWEWSQYICDEEGIYYQNGFGPDGYDKDGFDPEGYDRFGFDRNGYIEVMGCHLHKRDFRTTRDGRKNKYTHKFPDGVLVLFPRSDLTFYSDYVNGYIFYEDVLGYLNLCVNYCVYDDYQAYKKAQEEKDAEEFERRNNSCSCFEEYYDEGFGGSDWGV